jgi:hypothetical protein
MTTFTNAHMGYLKSLLDSQTEATEMLRKSGRMADYLATADALVETLRAAIATIEALPVTANGVRVVPGMKIYPLHPLTDENCDDPPEEDHTVAKLVMYDQWSGDTYEESAFELNYSSKEAAEAARTGKGGADEVSR